MNGQELAAILGISQGKLHGWYRLGFLHPQRGEKWTAHSYPPGEVEIAQKMARLCNVGFNPGPAHDVARGTPRVLAVLAEVLDDVTLETPPEPMRPVSEDSTEQAVLDAMDVATDLRDLDPREVWARLRAWMRDEPHRLVAAVVALAAMVPVETPVSELLAWTESLQVDQEVA